MRGAVARRAATPTAPVSSTNCNGSLSHAGTSDEPNLLYYGFHCNWGITAYTITANRKPNDYATLDDFSPDGTVVDAGFNIVQTVSFTCDGSIPGNGVSCATVKGTYMAAPDFAFGQIDTTDAYCANIPTGARRAEPQAIISVVVTDTNGAQDGPFRLNTADMCGPVPKRGLKTKHRRHKRRVRHAHHGIGVRT